MCCTACFHRKFTIRHSFLYSCRLLGVPFIVAFAAPIAVILVGNIVAFFLIIRSLYSSDNHVNSTRKVSGYQKVRRGFVIIVLVGLTWIFGILAIGEAKLAFQWLFCIFNTLQGFFIFLFFCVPHTGIRQQLRKCFQKMKSNPREELPLQHFGNETTENTLKK